MISDSFQSCFTSDAFFMDVFWWYDTSLRIFLCCWNSGPLRGLGPSFGCLEMDMQKGDWIMQKKKV